MGYTNNIFNTVWRYKKPLFGLGYYYNAKTGDSDGNRVYILYDPLAHLYTFDPLKNWNNYFNSGNELSAKIKNLILKNYLDKSLGQNKASVSFGYQTDKNGNYIKGSSVYFGNNTYLKGNNKESSNLIPTYNKAMFKASYNKNFLGYKNKRDAYTNNKKYKFDSNGNILGFNLDSMGGYSPMNKTVKNLTGNNDFITDIIGNINDSLYAHTTGNKMYDAIRYLLDKDGIYNKDRRLNGQDVELLLIKMNLILKQNGMYGLKVDGILGPSTYHMLKTMHDAGYNF